MRAAIAVGTLGPASCTSDIPLELVDVDFEDDRTIILTFSKELANASEVDPDAFRISLARSSDGGQTTTQYFEPGTFGLVEDCLEECYYDYISQMEVCEQACPGDPGIITVVDIDNAKNRHHLELGLSNPVGKPQCDWIDMSREDFWDAGFVVHYDGDRDPPVTAKDGETLDSIMAQWVEADDYVEVDDRFPALPGADPIPCPR